MYQCEASSVEGFIQQLAVSYFGHGYWFYVAGCVPEGKEPNVIDSKLIGKYEIDISKWARARQREKGRSGLQYIRHGRFFLIIATYGKHRFFEDEVKNIRDARKVPVKFAGYSVSYRGGHPHVRIEQEEYKRLKAYMLNLAVHRSPEKLAVEFTRIPFEPYAPVRRQLLNILRAVNKARKLAGFSALPVAVLRLKRRVVKPFR